VKLLSDQIFEAIVVSVDFPNGLCSLNPIDPSTQSVIEDVPLPHFAGNGSYGIFCGITVGTRVVALFTSVRGREVTVIVGLLPKGNLYENAFTQGGPSDIPSGVIPYPSIKDGDLILRSEQGAQISMFNSGDLNVTSVGGSGTYISRSESRASILNVSSDIVQYSNAGRIISGPVRRIPGIIRSIYPAPDLTETPLFADPDYIKRSGSIGFFRKEKPLKRSYRNRKRNPEISEYRMTINEFSSDFMFTGFDDEQRRVSGNLDMYQNSNSPKRNMEQSNILHMAEGELIEIVGGNLVDINGNILDINYRPISYGNDDEVPRSDLGISYDRARRVSRRGVGYHFQLSTNTRRSDPSEYSKNFAFDVDKEGVIKINVPSSTDTGNIPFSSNANYLAGDDSVDVTFLNASKLEPIPVFLRDENGQPVIPDKSSQGYTHRRTGVRYSVGADAYFPGNRDGAVGEIRVNTTKYHNMFATAERLIANTIKVINLPQRFTDTSGFPEGISSMKPFEVPIPESMFYSSTDKLQNLLGDDKSDFPTFMSVVAVQPGPPAIYHGGGMDEGNVGAVIAGRLYSDDDAFPPYSNDFYSELNGNEVSVDLSTEDEPARPAGGKSANINFEGSVETSIGSDNYDQKSLVIDTKGSIVSWIGKDRNNRSVITQTDGDMLLNIGGSYEGQDENSSVMNKGRLEIRVNVTDKKFVSTQFNNDSSSESNTNPGAESDYIISISENGIVIAGMKKAAPMIFRNDGPILIESSSSDVTLKGVQVRTVDPKGSINVIKPPSRNN